MFPLTIITRRNVLVRLDKVFLGSLEPLQQVLVHQSHVRIVLYALELIITVQILRGSHSVADNTAGLTGDDTGGCLEWVKYGIVLKIDTVLVNSLLAI